MRGPNLKTTSAFTLAFLLAVLIATTPAHSQTASELQKKITDSNAQIAALQAEISQYEKELEATQDKANTLSNTIAGLTLTQKKLSANIQLTQTQIDALDLQLQDLGQNIGNIESSINDNSLAVASSLRNLNEADDISMFETVLTERDLSSLWQSFDIIQQFQTEIKSKTDELQSLKNQLQDKQAITADKEAQLVTLKKQLAGQRAAVTETKNEQNKLLVQTKDQEANYQKLLAQKKAAAQALEDEVQAYEDQLKVIIDPSLYPKAGSAIFRSPLAPIRITQLFGNTLFARQNSSVYGGRPVHGGVDFAAIPGTPIYAPLGGSVVETGNTDSVSGCYSWGKWIFIDHKNGLSTIYAHLSVISVSKGDTVKTGQIIGYSGNTGYTTGPHLHFGVYITQATKIVPFKQIRSATNCPGLVTPVAPENGYADPLSYLPSLQ